MALYACKLSASDPLFRAYMFVDPKVPPGMITPDLHVDFELEFQKNAVLQQIDAEFPPEWFKELAQNGKFVGLKLNDHLTEEGSVLFELLIGEARILFPKEDLERVDLHKGEKYGR